MRELNPTEAERMFSQFLALKTDAALTQRTFPSVQELKSALSFQLLAPGNRKRTNDSTTGSDRGTDPSKRGGRGKGGRGRSGRGRGGKSGPTVAPLRMCLDYNNGNCKRNAQGNFCQFKDMVLQHACNKKLANGAICGEPHTKLDCPK